MEIIFPNYQEQSGPCLHCLPAVLLTSASGEAERKCPVENHLSGCTFSLSQKLVFFLPFTLSFSSIFVLWQNGDPAFTVELLGRSDGKIKARESTLKQTIEPCVRWSHCLSLSSALCVAPRQPFAGRWNISQTRHMSSQVALGVLRMKGPLDSWDKTSIYAESISCHFCGFLCSFSVL